QAQVQHAKQHENSEEWQFDAAIKRQAQSAQHNDLEAADMAEVLRSPLADRYERRAERHSAERHEDHLGAVRIEAGRGQSEHAARTPLTDHVHSLGTLWAKKSLRAGCPDHGETERETAVQVCP